MKVINKSDVKLIFHLNPDLYKETVIYKCLYWYTKKFEINIDKKDNYVIEITTDIKLPSNLEQKIKSDLIDFKLRDIVNEETKNIRDILYVKAFSDFDEFDQQPPGEYSDPVGFDINK
jgi:His-Xaa-Ser system protein HxsD